MGVSTDAKLAYGIAFPEGFEFPWTGTEDRDGDGYVDDGVDPEDWWRERNGYVQTPQIDYSNFNEDRGKPEWKAAWDEMYAHRKAFDLEHPIPFEVVYHCSDDYTMHILAVPGTEIVACRGDAKVIDPLQLQAMLLGKVQDVLRFKEFVETYIAPVVAECEESYWG
jgi:hypothetical protein